MTNEEVADFFRAITDPLAKKWSEYLDWLAEAMTYTMDCLGPHDDDSVAYKEEMDPVLAGMAHVRTELEVMLTGYEPDGARELVVGIRDFSDGFVADDVDRMNAGWTVLREIVGRAHPEILN